MKTQNLVVFYTIKASTIKKFLIIDFIAGTGIFYVLKIITTSVLVGVLGSMACTEGIKRFPYKKLF